MKIVPTETGIISAHPEGHGVNGFPNKSFSEITAMSRTYFNARTSYESSHGIEGHGGIEGFGGVISREVDAAQIEADGGL